MVCSGPCVCVTQRTGDTSYWVLGMSLRFFLIRHNKLQFGQALYILWESSNHYDMIMASVLHSSSSLILRQGCCSSSLFSHSGYLYCCLPVERTGMAHVTYKTLFPSSCYQTPGFLLLSHLWCGLTGAQTCWPWCMHIPYHQLYCCWLYP